MGCGVVALGCSSAGLFLATNHSPHFNRKFTSNGIVRFGRAALTVRVCLGGSLIVSITFALESIESRSVCTAATESLVSLSGTSGTIFT